MIALARLIGIFIACMGVIIILSPLITRRMMDFWRKDNRIYLGGLLRMLFGAVFLLSAPQARLSMVITALGLLLLVAGLLIFILKPERIKKTLESWDKRPDYVLRINGAVILVIGASVIYSL